MHEARPNRIVENWVMGYFGQGQRCRAPLYGSEGEPGQVSPRRTVYGLIMRERATNDCRLWYTVA